MEPGDLARLEALEQAVKLRLDLEHPEAWEAFAEIVAQAREAERLRENKTCRHCGWSGAPYHVVCPSCFTLAIETARQAKELETSLAEVERLNKTLTAALERYGGHIGDCAVFEPGPRPPCTCGLDRARGGHA